MAVKYKDYYAILGVPRKASQEEIQKAYRRLARKHHPDVSKDPKAEEKFKELGEAYEVLRDPEKRNRYDMLGSDFRAGQEFRPPPGFDNVFRNFRGRPQTGGFGGFSDFFETLFGGATDFEPQMRGGRDHEATIRITLEDAYRGGKRAISLAAPSPGPDSRMRAATSRYEVNIPKGILSGQKIRLAGQGGMARGGGPRGDLYLKVAVEPHPLYRLVGSDIYYDLVLAPWEAALGAEVTVPTPGGEVSLKVPEGTSSGTKLRLRGKGMPTRRGPAGNMYVVVSIAVPGRLTNKERELFKKMRDQSSFAPRS